MFTLIVLACLVLPVCAGAMKLALRLLGWTLNLAVGIVLLPLTLILAVCSGLAVAVEVLVPLALIIAVISAFVPES